MQDPTSPFDDSVSNRCFAVFLSILLMIPTGWGLFAFWTHDSSSDNQDWVLRAFVHVGMEVVASAFVLSVLGVIWGAFKPAWATRFLGLAQKHFAKALAAFVCVILAMLAFAVITLHGLLRFG
jgi:hypothetical protein